MVPSIPVSSGGFNFQSTSLVTDDADFDRAPHMRWVRHMCRSSHEIISTSALSTSALLASGEYDERYLRFFVMRQRRMWNKS